MMTRHTTRTSCQRPEGSSMSFLGKMNKLKKLMAQTTRRPIIASTVDVPLSGMLKNAQVAVYVTADNPGESIARKCIEYGAQVVLLGKDEAFLRTVSATYCEKCEYRILDAVTKRYDELPATLTGAVFNCMGIDNNAVRDLYFTSSKVIDTIAHSKGDGSIVFLNVHMKDPSGVTPKAILSGYVKGLAGELINANVRANAIHVSTDHGSDPSALNAQLGFDGALQFVVFLLSHASECITGQCVDFVLDDHI